MFQFDIQTETIKATDLHSGDVIAQGGFWFTILTVEPDIKGIHVTVVIGDGEMFAFTRFFSSVAIVQRRVWN